MLHHLFTKQAKEVPNSIALKSSIKQLSYKELDDLSNTVAINLQYVGIGKSPDEHIIIIADRSYSSVLAMMGVLKSGAAYVPIDLESPKDRVKFIIQDSHPKGIIVQKQHAHLYKNIDKDVAVFYIEDLCHHSHTGIQLPKDNDINDRLAYIIYTSGTTGRPKGVEITHANVTRLFEQTQSIFHFNHGDVIPLFHSMAFDFSVWELWSAFLYGGTLVTVPQDLTRTPVDFRHFLLNNKITILNQTPSAFNMLIQEEKKHSDSLDDLRCVVFGGEKLQFSSLRWWVKKYNTKKVRLINMYGITEATVHATYYQIKEEDVENNTPSIIGVPISDLGCYILNDEQKPVSKGEFGELYIYGKGLARGYLNLPKLTQERFITNSSFNKRLLKTGDIVRENNKGLLEYKGRNDDQVKIRGFRIELGEIETALCHHDSIAQCAIVKREDDGIPRLVAYYVLRKGINREDVSRKSLREFLKNKIPYYMVPSVFIQLDNIPLTTNGKVNKTSLPKPCKNGNLKINYSDLENKLVAIWAQLLYIPAEQIRKNDNFFELGGDSLSCLLFTIKAEEHGLNISVTQLINHPTIEELVKVIDTSGQKTIITDQSPIVGDIPLLPIQKWFFEQDLEDVNHWNTEFSLSLKQAIDYDTLKLAFRELIKHHDMLRAKFYKTGSKWSQECRNVDEIDNVASFQIVDSSLAKRRSDNSGLKQLGLDIKKGPIMKIILNNDYQQQPQTLSIIIHHLIIDGISRRILCEDLETVYKQLKQGASVNLPPKTTSYKEWGTKLIEYANSQELMLEQKYWLKQIHEPKKFPTDFDKGPNKMRYQKTEFFEWDVESTSVLFNSATEYYKVQFGDVLLTALSMSINRWSGRKHLRIALTGHGRQKLFNGVDLSRTIGWFMTLFPIKINLPNMENPIDSLMKIKDQLNTIPNEGIGYGILRYLTTSKVNRGLKEHFPNIAFNYIGRLDRNTNPSEIFTVTDQSFKELNTHKGGGDTPFYLMMIRAVIIDGKLKVLWSYSSKHFKSKSIRTMKESFIEYLNLFKNLPITSRS